MDDLPKRKRMSWTKSIVRRGRAAVRRAIGLVTSRPTPPPRASGREAADDGRCRPGETTEKAQPKPGCNITEKKEVAGNEEENEPQVTSIYGHNLNDSHRTYFTDNDDEEDEEDKDDDDITEDEKNKTWTDIRLDSSDTDSTSKTDNSKPKTESVWSRLTRLEERVDHMGEKTKAVEHALSSSGRDSIDGFRWTADSDDSHQTDTDVYIRTAPPTAETTASETENSTPKAESVCSQVRRLKGRADRNGEITKSAGNATVDEENNNSMLNKLISCMCLFSKKPKDAGNAIAKLESRMNSLERGLTETIDNFRAETLADRTRMRDMEDCVHRLTEELDALKAKHSQTKMTNLTCVQSLKDIIQLIQTCPAIKNAPVASDNDVEPYAESTTQSKTDAEADLSPRNEATPPTSPLSADDQTGVVVLKPCSARAAEASDNADATSMASSSKDDDVIEVIMPRGIALPKNDETGSNVSGDGWPTRDQQNAALQKIDMRMVSNRQVSNKWSVDGETGLVLLPRPTAAAATTDRLEVRGPDVWTVLQTSGPVSDASEERSPRRSDDVLPRLDFSTFNRVMTNRPFCPPTDPALDADTEDTVCYNPYSSLARRTATGTGSLKLREAGSDVSSPPRAESPEDASTDRTTDVCSSNRAEPEFDDYLRFLELAVWEEQSFEGWFANSRRDDVDRASRSADCESEGTMPLSAGSLSSSYPSPNVSEPEGNGGESEIGEDPRAPRRPPRAKRCDKKENS